MAGRQALTVFLIFVGGGIGSVLRHAANQAGHSLFPNFPAGTLFVNIVGSLAMGLVAGWFAIRGKDPALLRLFLTTGILGGFTTFSAFSLDAVVLWERGQTGSAGLYAAGSVVAAIIGVVTGLAITRNLLS